MKKKTRAKPKGNLKDLKARTNPKGGGIIVKAPGVNHNETLVSTAV